MSSKKFLSVYNDVNKYPTVADVANVLDLSERTVRRHAKTLKADGEKVVDRTNVRRGKKSKSEKEKPVPQQSHSKPKRKLRQHESPFSEIQARYKPNATEEDCIAELRRIVEENPEEKISRMLFRNHATISEATWTRYFGTFQEFKRQANVIPSRQQQRMEAYIAKQASVDHYRALHQDLQPYAGKFDVPFKGRYRRILVGTDFHDKQVDPFTLRIFIEAAHRIQPDVVCFGGDMWDALEFGKYGYDPREFDLTGSLNFLHDEILAPVRNAAPDAQIDYLCGNHEMRVLRELADATPALKVLLSEFHDMSFSKLLGLDQFNMNFYAKGDLAIFNKTDEKKALYKNSITYNDSFFVSHYPTEARKAGLPAVAGHHHKHIVWPEYSRLSGSYEVHQLGAGHRRYASYCNADIWGNGFATVIIDTLTNTVQINYIDTTPDIVDFAGQYYIREDDEK